MPGSILASVIDERRRHAVADLLVRLVETIRDDYFPGTSTSDAFELALIGTKMWDMLDAGRMASASALSRATGIPRATVQRRLAYMKRLGAIEQHGSKYTVSLTYMNRSTSLDGHARRMLKIVTGSKKLAEQAH
jgi:predicted transcriptional regulator